MATEIDAARLLTYRAAHLEDRGQRHTYESSVAKLFASEVAHRAVDSAVQIHGGYGFIKDYVVEKLYRDHRVTEIYERTSEIHRLHHPPPGLRQGTGEHPPTPVIGRRASVPSHLRP